MLDWGNLVLDKLDSDFEAQNVNISSNQSQWKIWALILQLALQHQDVK